MRIVYNRLNECFDLRNDMLNFITVENVRYFEDLVVSVYEQIKTLPVSITSHTARSLEINASGVSKARGLRALCGALDIDMSECIAIGDAQNDEEMLKAVGFKAAMANGSDRVKAIADVIAPDCDSDGVAAIIEQYFLD